MNRERTLLGGREGRGVDFSDTCHTNILLDGESLGGWLQMIAIVYFFYLREKAEEILLFRCVMSPQFQAINHLAIQCCSARLPDNALAKLFGRRNIFLFSCFAIEKHLSAVAQAPVDFT